MQYNLTVSDEFAVSRILKSGKTVRRGLLGVLRSGTRDERNHIDAKLSQRLIENNTFAPVMLELERVFPISTLKSKKDDAKEPGAVYLLGDEYWICSNVNGQLAIEPYQPGASDLRSAVAYASAIMRKCDGKEVKGDRARALQDSRAIVTHAIAKEMSKLEATEQAA